MTTANLEFDPLAVFAIRIPTPGSGVDYAAEARAEIERRYGPEVAEDFTAAYRDNDRDAAERVASRISGALSYKISRTAENYLGEILGDKVEMSIKSGVGNYRSEAHFVLAVSLEMAALNKKKKLEQENTWTPPAPRPPQVKKPRIL